MRWGIDEPVVCFAEDVSCLIQTGSNDGATSSLPASQLSLYLAPDEVFCVPPIVSVEIS